MSRRDGYQPGVPCWVAAGTPEPQQTARYYVELFGWETEDLSPPGSPGSHYLCKLRGRDVAAVVSQRGAPTWGTYIWVDSADEVVATVADAGGGVVAEPFDSPGGGRTAILSDPSGAVFSAWQPGERKGAQLVNEPGAWSMSLLHAPERERAKDFYGAVFGWETDTFEMGESAIALWRLPGYVGGEPEQPVARDVIGVMLPTAGGVAPHWSVDFWVGDADATAAKAAALGGKVIAPPYDAPGFRQAVLADPHGAAFTVSKLTPAA